MVREFFQDARFRHAISYAIERDGNVAHLISTGASNFWSPKWADWHLSGGAEGEQPNALMMEAAIEYYSKAQSSMDLEEQNSATGHPLRLFVRGDPYKLWGLWDGDEQGRDLLHRRQGGGLHGARDHVPAPGAVVPEPHHRVGNAGDPVDDLGIGLQPPAISWGVLLKAAQNVKAIVATPWLPSPTRRPAG